MKLELKIIIGWLCLLALLGLTLLAPHRDFAWVGIVNVAVNVLMAALCLLIARQLTSRAQRLVCVVLAAHFGFSLFLYASGFMGTAILADNRYISFYYHYFVNKVGFNLLWALTAITLTMTVALPRLGAAATLAGSAALSLLLVVPMFLPYLTSPLELRSHPDYVLFGRMQAAAQQLRGDLGRDPDAGEIAAALDAGGAAGAPTADTRADVVRLHPYLAESSATVLFWRPVELATVKVMLILIALMAALLAYIWRSDITLHPYIDKILVALLLLGVVEALGAYSAAAVTSNPVYAAFVAIGQYVTIVCELLCVVVLDLKLRFVLSHAGKYYEFALQHHPAQVTRWKDEFDRYIIRTFFSSDKQARRLAETVSREQDI